MFCKGTKYSTDRVKRQMFHGGAEYSMERVKWSMEVLYIQRRGSNGPWRCYIFPGEGQMFHGGAKYSSERVKCHGGAKYATDNVKYSTDMLNISRTM